MTSAPQNSIASMVPVDVILPEDPEELRRILDDLLKKIIDSLNDKDIGHYNTVEELNGQRWFTDGNPQQFKRAYRKVVNFGALPNTGTKTVSHGITWNANTTFTRIYGCATKPSTVAIPIPYSDPNALINNILLSVDTTNVTITTAANYSTLTNCYVILDYLQN